MFDAWCAALEADAAASAAAAALDAALSKGEGRAAAKRGGERTGEERKGDRVGEADAARTEAAKLLMLRAGEIGPKRLEGLDATPGTGLRLMACDGLDSRFSNFIVASKAATCAFERLAAAALAKRPGGLRLRERRPPLALKDPPAPMVAPGS
jgi:hypothetical protein